MSMRFAAALAAAIAAVAPPPAAAQDNATLAVKPAFAQDSMNVFRRFPLEQRTAMVDFYTKAIGLASLNPIQLNPRQQMLLYRVGTTGQIKLAAGIPAEGRQYRPGSAIDAAVGIRLLTFTFADEKEVTARFKAAGLPAPRFRTVSGKRFALVRDPAGFNVALVIDPATASSVGVEVGINVTDLARSRAFYRDFAGLDELPPVQDPVTGHTKYPFRHGETIVSLWSAGRNLPADTGSAGIQYVTTNVDAINARAIAEHVTVETPLGGVPGFNVKTVWLNDPDGATNYFYQLGAGANRPPAGN